MIRRCYNEGTKDKFPAYYGICKVCNQWLNMQIFSEWFEENKYECGERLHIDKDILYPGNKIYSPDTCIFVPQSINCFFTEHNISISRGVSFRKDTKKYTARISIYNTQRVLGCYNTKEEAELHYIKARKEYIEEVLKKYENKIPLEIYNKLKKVIYNEFEN